MSRLNAVIVLAVMAVVWIGLIFRADASGPEVPPGYRYVEAHVIPHSFNDPERVHRIPTECGNIYVVIEVESI